ncbi:MAG: lipopolysaccharide A protein [Coxiellaceae bacterium]|nr:lipopolysaccharide A protein [Coxiellaceae bacterium]
MFNIKKEMRFRKFNYYVKMHLHQKIYPYAHKNMYKTSCYRLMDNSELASRVLKRVNYYNRLKNTFCLTSSWETPELNESCFLVNQNSIFKTKSASCYQHDMAYYMSHFPKSYHLHLLPGDITHIPSQVSVLKSRPIMDSRTSENAVIMKLNAIRHFKFIRDNLSFSDKRKGMVWRGNASQKHRKDFLQRFYHHPLMNVGQVKKLSHFGYKDKLSLSDQLKYQFILCIEGNDVATNLKWAMSSNSLCVMTKPNYETWFMEGLLQPGVHYIEVKDDYSNLEEKIDYYSSHSKEAQEIIEQSSRYCLQFLNRREEDLIAFLVLEKFFHYSGQLNSSFF